MNKFEYLKVYWKYIDTETPVIMFYEVDLENQRYAARIAEIYIDKKIIPIIESGFEFVTEQPVPTVNEINKDDEFFAEIISQDEFEHIYNSSFYSGSVDFPV